MLATLASCSPVVRGGPASCDEAAVPPPASSEAMAPAGFCTLCEVSLVAGPSPVLLGSVVLSSGTLCEAVDWECGADESSLATDGSCDAVLTAVDVPLLAAGSDTAIEVVSEPAVAEAGLVVAKLAGAAAGRLVDVATAGAVVVSEVGAMGASTLVCAWSAMGLRTLISIRCHVDA